MEKIIKIKLDDVDDIEITYMKFKDFLSGFYGKHELEVEMDNVKIKDERRR